MENTKTKRLVGIALMGAIAFVISMIEFPLFPTTPFLKIDFSDIPIFFGMYVFGPAGGVIIAFIRSLLSYISGGGDAGFPIGSTASFVASVSLTLPIYYIIINKTLTLGRKFFAGLVATISLTVMLGILNYFFVLPAYLTVMGFDISSVTGSMRNYIIYFLIPFNIIKGGLVSSIIFIMYERMKSWLIKQRCALGTESTSQHSNSNISIHS
ncbi:MAG TPA: ECF transporter S component [Alloiococcus sp.]|nr:ECF transporter S component [Alloiococcus sp.]